jgi:hypothetical protein
MFVFADVPTVGLYYGSGFAFLAVVALVVGALMIRKGNRSNSYSSDDLIVVGWVVIGCAVVTQIIVAISMWPYKYEYHHYVTKSGSVEQISKRIISNGDNGISERYVIKMYGDPFPYGIDDTRASLLKVGEHVAIKCKKEHQFFQPYNQDGWACRWGG